jgi:hypothetical protein
MQQTINLQMGRFDFGYGNPLAPNMYGKFTINLGIFVPEVFDELIYWETKRPTFVNEADCIFSVRLGQLFAPYQDRWWSINDSSDIVTKEIIDLLQSYGLPVLNQFSNREAIISGWDEFRQKYKLRKDLFIHRAIMLSTLGRQDESIQMYQKALAVTENPSAIEVLKKHARKFGWEK